MDFKWLALLSFVVHLWPKLNVIHHLQQHSGKNYFVHTIFYSEPKSDGLAECLSLKNIVPTSTKSFFIFHK